MDQLGRGGFSGEADKSSQERFEEALKLDSANLTAREGMAHVYFAYALEADQKGDHRKAYEQLRKCIIYTEWRHCNHLCKCMCKVC